MKKLSIIIILMMISHSLVIAQTIQQYNCIYCGENTLGSSSSAIGIENNNLGSYSTTIGEGNTIYEKLFSVTLIGKNNKTINSKYGLYSTAIGMENIVNADKSYLIGISDTVSGTGGVAIGTGVSVSDIYSIGIGLNSKAYDKYSVSIGNRAITSGMNSYSFGNNVWSKSSGSITIGTSPVYLKNETPNSLVIGFNSDVPTFFVKSSSGVGTSGRIGIGNITSPDYKLHIMADNNEDAAIFLQPTEGTNYLGKILFGDESHSISAKTSEPLKFFTESGQGFSFKTGNILQTTGYSISTSQIKAPDANGLSLTDQYDNGIFVDDGGNVGIGVENPSTKFHIEDSVLSIQLRSLTQNDYAGMFINHSISGGQYEWYAGTPQGDAGKFVIASKITVTHDEATADIVNAGFVIKKIENPVDLAWQVGIGTNNLQSGYILTIDGKVTAEEVLIQNSDKWYDFVFDEGYDLPSLAGLDEYVKQHKHLPDVPTAKEVAENGYKLGEMNGILLKKVEELTLYVIEQQKEIEKLKEIVGNGE